MSILNNNNCLKDYHKFIIEFSTDDFQTIFNEIIEILNILNIKTLKINDKEKEIDCCTGSYLNFDTNYSIKIHQNKLFIFIKFIFYDSLYIVNGGMCKKLYYFLNNSNTIITKKNIDINEINKFDFYNSLENYNYIKDIIKDILEENNNTFPQKYFQFLNNNNNYSYLKIFYKNKYFYLKFINYCGNPNDFKNDYYNINKYIKNFYQYYILKNGHLYFYLKDNINTIIKKQNSVFDQLYQQKILNENLFNITKSEYRNICNELYLFQQERHQFSFDSYLNNFNFSINLHTIKIKQFNLYNKLAEIDKEIKNIDNQISSYI